ncbi:MAG: hypothetical protein GY898_13775 [Proteobacteria bacterium]|nr:hypothetical protein [Pseudomonadota bacterium]
MAEWLKRLFARRSAGLESLPLGVEGELPWHCSVADARCTLRSLGALSLDVDGYPTARLRWGDLTVRATLEFVPGVHVGAATWLSAMPDADFYTREGFKVRMEPRLRAANVHFPFRNRRGNWARALEILGKPGERHKDGSWSWEWPHMTARFTDADPGDEESVEWLRFAAKSTSRVLQIRNQSSMELYERIHIRMDFQAGHWEMTQAPEVHGIPTRLHWDAPVDQPVLLTVKAEDREVSVEVSSRLTTVVLTNDSSGGIRVVV